LKIDTENIAITGHSCGGMESIANFNADMDKRIKTSLLLSTGGAASQAALGGFDNPSLWIHGGSADVAYGTIESNYKSLAENKKDLPTFKVGLFEIFAI
jgi:predicted peptidase